MNNTITSQWEVGMRFPAIIILSALGIHAACAGDDVKTFLLYPPPAYDHPYQGVLRVEFKDAEEIKKWCHPNERGQRLACARVDYPDPGQCLIIIGPEDEINALGWTDNAIVRHERGHCNGWPGTHPHIRSLRGSETYAGWLARYNNWRKFKGLPPTS